MFHYTVESDKSISRTIELLTKSFQEDEFGVLWQFNLKDKLQAKGLEFDQDYYVLEVCNPFEAKRILSNNKVAGYFLPCKVVVYEDQGKTKIGLPKPTSLIDLVDDSELVEIAKDVEERLIKCINSVNKQ